MSDDQPPDNLPSVPEEFAHEVLDSQSQYPATTSVALNSRLSEVQLDDLARVNYILYRLKDAWDNATGVDDTCKMTLTTLKVLEVRRKIMQLPFGTKLDSGGDDDDDSLFGS